MKECIFDCEGNFIEEREIDTPTPTKPKADPVDLLSAQVQALTDRNDFLENCVAEMATKVYAQ